jgi:DNA uptake protein ComE-like DNA-binding protein
VKQQLKDFLSFGKSERNAILFLVVLIVLVVLLPAMYVSREQPELRNREEFAAEIEQFMQLDKASSAVSQQDFDFNEPDKAVGRAKFTPFQFDPNVLDEQGWMALGFSSRQAEGIIKYRDKGARFKVPEDLKRLYAFNDEVYKILEPYINIPAQASAYASAEREKRGNYPAYEQFTAELNSSDSATLVKVRGIGPAFARRIIRYREKLGGFASTGQLLEVYGMDSARYAQMSKGVFVDTSLIRKFNVNTASLEELRAHPYIDYYIAKALVDARIRKGAFASPADVKSIPLIYDELYYKLLPYISIH